MPAACTVLPRAARDGGERHTARNATSLAYINGAFAERLPAAPARHVRVLRSRAARPVPAKPATASGEVSFLCG